GVSGSSSRIAVHSCRSPSSVLGGKNSNENDGRSPDSRLLIVGACPRGLRGETAAGGIDPTEGTVERCPAALSSVSPMRSSLGGPCPDYRGTTRATPSRRSTPQPGAPQQRGQAGRLPSPHGVAARRRGPATARGKGPDDVPRRAGRH